MIRPVKWRRIRVVGWAVLALTVSACALLWYLKMRSLYSGHAVLVVGAASLKFAQLHGIAPGDVRDLVNDGLLVVEANGAYTLRQLGPYRVPGDFVRPLRLRFPGGLLPKI